MSEELDIITLADEDGNEVNFEIATYIPMGDKEYVVLVPQDEEDEEVLILRVEQEDEETEVFVDEEDEEILQKVFDAFRAEYADEYNFVDDEDEDALFTDAE